MLSLLSAPASNLNDGFTVGATDGVDPAVTRNVDLWVGTGGDDSVSFVGNTADDILAFGLTGNDTFTLTNAQLASNAFISGGQGGDTVVLNDANGVTVTDSEFAHLTGIEQVQIGGSGTNTVTLGSVASREVNGGPLNISDASGTGNLTVDGSAMTTSLVVIAGTGVSDNLAGGSGNDTFEFKDANFDNLGTPQTVTGGRGSDTIFITDQSTEVTIVDRDLTNVTGIERLRVEPGAGHDATITLGAIASSEIGSGTLTVDGSQAIGDLFVDVHAMTTPFALLGGSARNEFDVTNAQLAAAPVIQGVKNASANIIDVVDAATIADSAFKNLSNIDDLSLINANNTVTLASNAAQMIGTGTLTIGAQGGVPIGSLTVDASAFVGAGHLDLVGNTGNDLFVLNNAYLSSFASGSQVHGGGGADTLRAIVNQATITDAEFAGISDVETLLLGDFTNSVAIGANMIASAAGATFKLDDTAAKAGHGLTVDATALTSSEAVTLLGGAGNDMFEFTSAGFSSSKAISGGGGTDTIVLTTTASVAVTDSDFADVTGVKTLKIAGDSGTNSVMLGTFADTDAASVGGMLTIDDSAGTAPLSLNAQEMSHDLTVIAGSATSNGPLATYTFFGSNGDDTFVFTDAVFDSASSHVSVQGGVNGNNTISISGTSDINVNDSDFAFVSHVQTLQLGGDGTDTITLGQDASAAVGSGTFSVDASGTTGPDLDVNGSSMTADLTVIAGSSSTDTLLGGSGDDTFEFTIANYHAAQQLNIEGNGGNNTLWITDTDNDITFTDADFSHLSDIDTLKLGGEGTTDTVTLGFNAELAAAGVSGNQSLTIDDTTSEGLLLLDASSYHANLEVLLGGVSTITGGSGKDTFVVSQEVSANITGGTGTNTYAYDLPLGDLAGFVTINDFKSGDIFEVAQTMGGISVHDNVSAEFGSDNTANFKPGEHFHFDTANQTLYFQSFVGEPIITLATVEAGVAVTAGNIHIVSHV